MIPLQDGDALSILFEVLGISMLSGFVYMALIMGIVAWGSKRNRRYEFQLVKMCDLHTTNEFLNYMRVIKLQAWEDHFQTHIETFRNSKYEWLCKTIYPILVNIITLWSMPSLVSVVTFTT